MKTNVFLIGLNLGSLHIILFYIHDLVIYPIPHFENTIVSISFLIKWDQMVLCFSRTQLHDIMYKPDVHGMMTWDFSCQYGQGSFWYQLFKLAWNSEWILAWNGYDFCRRAADTCGRGAALTQDFFSSKFRFHVTNFCPHSPLKKFWSLQNFTHATTAVLSWHV